MRAGLTCGLILLAGMAGLTGDLEPAARGLRYRVWDIPVQMGGQVELRLSLTVPALLYAVYVDHAPEAYEPLLRISDGRHVYVEGQTMLYRFALPRAPTQRPVVQGGPLADYLRENNPAVAELRVGDLLPLSPGEITIGLAGASPGYVYRVELWTVE